ncbi:MAG: eukaryotic-like serine/threonine-protein kinase [Actinomycetota bacterium]
MAGGRIADQVGRVLGGRYRLVAPIGTGGSAHVYVADDTTLRRRVAVKVLQPALALDQAFLKRFRAEAQAAAALNHANIMRVFDWGEDPEGPFLVLEFLGGGSLRDLLDSGRRLTVSQAVLVGLEAARALDYAHRRGLVHRDIKPANICFDEEGRACITDFGLARALAEAAWTEPDGVLLGTARYAAPEAAQGRNVDGKADVYALGWVLLEAVTGNAPPVANTTVATLMARASQPIVAPFGLGALAPIIDAAGVVDPDDRPDAAALAVMLDTAARQLDAPAPIPVTAVLDLDARTPSAADPTEMGVTASVPVVEPTTTVAVAPPVGRRSRRRIGWVIGALALVAAVVMGALYAPTLFKPSHHVPSLAHDDLQHAAAELAPLKFKLASKEAYSDTVANGEVIRQRPAAGVSLHEDETVTVVISKGPPPVAIPKVVGRTEAEARTVLTGAGFQIDAKVNRPYSEDVAKGTVIAITPDAANAPKGSVVALTVSNGPEPRTISNWTNQPFADAKAGIEKAGLEVKRVDGYSDTVAVGNVISTSPGAGKTAERGSTVTVTVCVGTQTVAVPNVSGQTVDQATATLQAQGLAVGPVYGPGGKNRHVFLTSPGPGTRVNRGTPVNLYVQ